jgi:two-component system nitrogen regulation sensor histidine kinase GlnL
MAMNARDPHWNAARYAGLDHLSTAVAIVDARGYLVFVNQAAEALTDTSRRTLTGMLAHRLFTEDGVIDAWLERATRQQLGERRQLMHLRRPLREPVPVQVTVTPLYSETTPIAIEMTEVEQQLKVSREVQQYELSEANRQLLRNLAHEIKNPLGGIRGAAQLLQHELAPEQLEYTRVIISEADRLQGLLDRVLAPHRSPRVVVLYNLHEVCERVRSVILAEFPCGLEIERDYDASVPDARGDKEQLIQAVLNVVRNAAQALAARIAGGDAKIVLRTRVARQVTIARRHHRLALDLHVIDNGPGVPEELQGSVFYPLVSGREGGTGLGLSLAQTYIQGNDGVIELESRPGCTDFRILLPLAPAEGLERGAA